MEKTVYDFPLTVESEGNHAPGVAKNPGNPCCLFAPLVGAFFRLENVMEDDQKSFEEKVRPLIEWLAEHANPHSSVIVTSTDAELLTGEMVVKTDEYLKD